MNDDINFKFFKTNSITFNSNILLQYITLYTIKIKNLKLIH